MLAALTLTIMLSGCTEHSPIVAESLYLDAPLQDRLAPVNSATTEDAHSPRSDIRKLSQELGIVEDYRAAFIHGEKPAEYQKYIVLHDTEGWGSPQSVIDYWDGNGSGVAAHFIVGVDGSVYQCVLLDKIAHHAGFGDIGNNQAFDVEDESRDDREGTVSIGPTYPDYGMNSYSVGIEMVHVGGDGDYPIEQLTALDKLIAYIDAYFGLESSIIDHKAWRSTNSDTSPEFAEYLRNYQEFRSYQAVSDAESKLE
jgi:hypothetical protein